MDTANHIREQLTQARTFLAGTLSGISEEDMHKPMPGALNTIAATYAHVVTGEDGFVNALIRGGAPLFATSWAGFTGLSAMPPEGPGWRDWGASLRVDRQALGGYATAVATETDSYLASLSPGDLTRLVDLSGFGFGQKALGWVLGAGVVGHVYSHWGEICAMNGVTGGKGFPL
jgi:hypothetical protein